MTTRSLSRTVAVTAALAATTALACPVCGYGQDGSEGAYIGMSIVLSLLPLGLMGGVVVWLWRSARAKEHENRPTTQLAPAPRVNVETGPGVVTES